MGVRDLWHSLTWSQERIEAEELLRRVGSSSESGVTPVAQCEVGETVTIEGVVHSISLRPQAITPALEVDLYDGSGHVQVIWLGRRSIPGIQAGRSLVVVGRMTRMGEQCTIFNPKYRLLPMAS